MQEEKSNQIRRQAETFLAEKSIEDILSKYGKVIFTGSYSTNLMVWNDIDLQLVLPNSEDRLSTITQLAQRFLQDPDVKSIKLIDTTVRKREKLPTGVYLGVNYYTLISKWKLDIWALDSPDLEASLRFNKSILDKLTPELRALILKLKFKVMSGKDRMPPLSSYYIYQAILNEGLKGEEEILKYLNDRQIAI